MDEADTTVFVVDADPGTRQSLCNEIMSAGLGAEFYASAEDFLDIHTGDEPGCVLLELHLPGMGGLALMEQLRAHGRQIPVILITDHADVSAAVHGMKLGAIDLFVKPIDHHVLVATILAAIAQDATRRRNRAQIAHAQARLAVLTDRECELLAALMVGKSSKQIAAGMRISLRTVQNHRAHMLAKTGAENTADLVRIGMLATFVTPVHLHPIPFAHSRGNERCSVMLGPAIAGARSNPNRRVGWLAQSNS